jgi:hypothetical protein
MGSVEAQPASAPPRAEALTPSQLAWVALVPCALATLATIVLLGPPLGHALFAPHGGDELWPREAVYVIGRPEPVKHARYALSLLGPAALAAVVLVRGRRSPVLRPTSVRAIVAASQALTAAFVVAAVIGQRDARFTDGTPSWIVFGAATIAIGAALALALLLLPRAAPIARALHGWLRDTRSRRVASAAVATAITAMWLTIAIDSDRTIALSQVGTFTFWILDDPFAVLQGLTPLVDFHPVYAQLWPYPAALVLRAFGGAVLAYTLLMATASGLSLLAIYGLLRRVTRSAVAALALYLPFVATGFLFMAPTATTVHLTNAQMLNMWPMRYGGAYVLAWLTARQLDRAAPRRTWVLFLFGGVVAIDNVEFGSAAIAATLAALACAGALRSWRAAGRLAAHAAGGLLGALLLVALLTLAHSGRLPDFGLALEFPRLFGVVGLLSLPMPLLGFHLVMYATFAAAIAVAAVRLARRDEDALLTGTLMWSGVFGLLAGSYFVGHSDFFKLGGLLSGWALALVLLVVVTARSLAARGWRRPSLAEAMVLVGFGVAICSLAETPTPWSQAQRLRHTTARDEYRFPEAAGFVAQRLGRGRRAILLIALGHRVAYDVGVRNVSPYSYMEAIVTRRQFQMVLDTARRRRVHDVFVTDQKLTAAHLAVLAAAGFARRAGAFGVSDWSDAP